MFLYFIIDFIKIWRTNSCYHTFLIHHEFLELLRLGCVVTSGLCFLEGTYAKPDLSSAKGSVFRFWEKEQPVYISSLYYCIPIKY